MLRLPRWWLGCVVLSVSALAHEPDGGDDDELDGGLSHVVVPPRILAPVEAIYPPAELAERREAHVHLELEVDAIGKVTEVHAGFQHGFH